MGYELRGMEKSYKLSVKRTQDNEERKAFNL